MPRLTSDLDVIRHALMDQTLSQVGDVPFQLRLTAPATIGKLSIAPHADISTMVFNRPDDRDKNGVFAGDSNPHIPWNQNSAWVKTTLSAKATGSIAGGRVSAGAGRHLVMSDYRLHAATDGAVRAIRRDLASFRSITRLSDVCKLKPGEALTLDLDGDLSLALRLSWADILSDRLYPILSSIGVRGPVVVKIRTGASAAATVRLRDRFSLVISRDGQGRFRFAIKKAVSRDHSFSFDVSLAGDVNGTPIIEEALEPLIEAIIGEAYRKVESLAPRLGVDRLSNEERELIGRIAARLGVETAQERARAVREAFEKLKRALRTELEKSLRWKASSGFAYEYARVDEETEVADYVLLDSAHLAGDHGRTLSGDFAHVEDALRGEKHLRSVVRYLNEAEGSRTSSSGFSLGVGKWIDLRTRDEQAFRQITRTSLDGFRLITFRGARKYSEKNVPQNDFEWTVDLKAQMNEYREQPSTRDFDFGLHYAVTLERTNLAPIDLEHMFDFAAMWDVRVPDASSFTDALGKKAIVRLNLLFDRDDLSALLGDLPEDEWAPAFAAAMPWMSHFPERRSFVSRQNVYSAAWKEWLRGANHPIEGWAAILRPHIESGLQLVENRALPGSFAWTAGEGHPLLRDRHSSFRRGLARLHFLMQAEQPAEAIHEVWTALHPFWSQRLYLAASGNYLLALARTRGIEVQRSMQIALDETTILI